VDVEPSMSVNTSVTVPAGSSTTITPHPFPTGPDYPPARDQGFQYR
jgi:hypothetical protein